jgi:hypothetical protein
MFKLKTWLPPYKSPWLPPYTAQYLANIHLALAVAWAIAIPVTLITGWIQSVIFVSIASIYANLATHLSAWQAARAELRQDVKDEQAAVAQQ